MAWAVRDLNKFEYNEIPLYMLLDTVKPGEDKEYTKKIGFNFEGKRITLVGKL